ncbi:mannose-1-phosphate guanylyltransferase/mannose-6-phosphate isomerase [Thiothrix subterranea]|uniref:mannose-1-phosphate guanylyltransferase n=1 Tax=Thiothrix subterranea TaxID=2735563 RepID=A0ABU0Y427_9GAMM|nr:mannose-1-phosphate guanylyltransferase/mannose-6-phosphate isomerase [Thiothrix subterranea]MDQ5767534.1 mannose-1-phosphate guanylyltransferase/mannose-6-phosphate isomerase [Thiothrix subterranea]
MITPIILSGGSGTRLWPLSRQLRPKQFLPIVGNDTLFQETVQRLHGIEGLQPPFVICNEDHRFMVAEQLQALGLQAQGILLEPVGRNTAPAIALAALRLLQQNQADAVMLVLPADHVIHDAPAFHQAVIQAAQAAYNGHLVTFGIVPHCAETGYGYIRHGEPLADSAGYRVAAFVEKPDQSTAAAYLESGHYLWNSGMFLFRADYFLKELADYAPDVLSACETALANAKSDSDFIRLDSVAFAACPAISVDYAVMEKTARAVVIPLDAGWNDVGAWSAVWEVGQADHNGNVIRGDALTHNANNNLIYTEHRLVSLVGVDNLVVVETKDATLVAHRDQVQDVKHIVGQLQARQRPEATIHREVNRPWGTYDCIDGGERFQVKRIMVKPGAKLSLQMHHHRAEHWIVVSGTAEVRCGNNTLLLTENQSTYIPLGEVHSLSNPGKVPLEIIEVQSGSYLGEDDIVRFEDAYGRVC